MEYDEPHLLLDDFLRRGMVISPWFTMNSHARFDVEMFTRIDQLANDMVSGYWTETEKTMFSSTFPLSDRVARTAVYEIISSTALFLAHHQFGNFEIDQEQVNVALELLKEFISEHGFGNTVKLYGFVTSFENALALYYYESIPERIFNLGCWHRPWVDYSLSDELLWGISMGSYQIDIVDETRHVFLTDKGQESFLANRKLLEDSGYLANRVRQLQILNFSMYQNYTEVANEFWPNFMEIRKDFLKWSGLQLGMRVLELGCGDGISTFDAGLADRVGKDGQVIAIDPSMGMISRANKRKEQLQISWVTFLQASAEQLPFENESFDAVIAFSSLHFMDLPRALAEIQRVLKPNGSFASLHPLKFNMGDHQLVAEWIAPIAKLAKYRNDKVPKDYLKNPNEISNEFEKSGLINISEGQPELIIFFKDPETVVNHLIRGVGWAQEELSMLPWKAREDVINEVLEQGKLLCEKYPAEQRIIKSPLQSIKGDKKAIDLNQ